MSKGEVERVREEEGEQEMNGIVTEEAVTRKRERWSGLRREGQCFRRAKLRAFARQPSGPRDEADIHTFHPILQVPLNHPLLRFRKPLLELVKVYVVNLS